MAAIPAWVYILLRIAFSLGSPFALAWLRNKIKKLPQEVKDIIDSLINGIKDPEVDTKEAKRVAKRGLKRYCEGAACPPETKSDK